MNDQNHEHHLLDQAHESALCMLQKWAHDVLVTTSKSLLRSLVLSRRRNQKHGDIAPRNTERTIHVSEQDVSTVYEGTIRLGLLWVDILEQNGELDASRAVRGCCERGKFLEQEEVEEEEEDIPSDDDDGDKTDDNLFTTTGNLENEFAKGNNITTTNQQEDDSPIRIQQPLGWVDPCQLLQPTTTTSSTSDEWKPLPGTTGNGGIHIPKATNIHPSQIPSTINNGQAFGRPNPTMNTKPLPFYSHNDDDDENGSSSNMMTTSIDHQQEWVKAQIYELDRRGKGDKDSNYGYGSSSAWYYDWGIIDRAAKENVKRLHNSRLRSRFDGGATLEYEIVPKGMTLRDVTTTNTGDDENDAVGGVLANSNQTDSSNKNNNGEEEEDDQAAASSKNGGGNVPVVVVEEGPLGTKITKLVRQKREKKAQQLERAKKQQNEGNNNNTTNQKPKQVPPKSDGRPPSNASDCRIPFIDIQAEIDGTDGKEAGTFLTNQMIHNDNRKELDCLDLTQGALKEVGLYHLMYQSMEEDASNHLSSSSNHNHSNKRRPWKEDLVHPEKRMRMTFTKARKERLGGFVMDGSGVETKRQFSKVVRMEKRDGKEYIELDLGECLVELFDSSIENDASARDGGDDDGGEIGKKKKLYAFSSLEMSLLDS